MQQYPELNLNYDLQLQERMSIGSELGAAWTLAGKLIARQMCSLLWMEASNRIRLKLEFRNVVCR